MALIHLCNQESVVGRELHQLNYDWQNETHQPTHPLWSVPHQFLIYVPQPDQQFEGMTLESGLTQGFNIEVKQVNDRPQIPYALPRGGHFVIVLKQKGLDSNFEIAAVGIFVRSLAILSLDIIVDPDKPEYQSVVVKHPIIRDYPTDWQQKLKLFIKGEIPLEALPSLVNNVDQAFNLDYRPPAWQDVCLMPWGGSVSSYF